jgi:hypothetical protein
MGTEDLARAVGGATQSNEAAGRRIPCICTVVRKVVRYKTQASSKAQLIRVADVRAMSALPPKADINSARVGYSRMLLASGESERILCEFGDGLGCEPERFCDIGRASRHAETIDPEGNALIADPTRPAEGCGGFNRDARGYFGR